MFFQNILHRQRDDDFAGATEKGVGFGERVARVIEADEKAFLTFLAHHHGLEGVNVRAARFVFLFHLDGRGAKLQRYLARIVKWWVLTGGGDTPEEAVRDLAVQFERIKNDWERDGKPLPRPGTQVPIEFAPSSHVDANSDLATDFIQRVFGLDWAFITDGTSLWDFHTNENNDALHAKIKTVYGVDVSDIESGNLATILDRIAASRSQ